MVAATTGKLHPGARTNPLTVQLRDQGRMPEGFVYWIKFAGNLLLVSTLDNEFPADNIWHSECRVFDWTTGNQLFVRFLSLKMSNRLTVNCRHLSGIHRTCAGLGFTPPASWTTDTS